jgi:hypothetical protein
MEEWPMLRTNMIAIVFATVLGAGFGVSPAAAQVSDVGYVEAVSGRVVAFAREAPALVDVLDVVGDRTRFDLLPNSELRLCHYGTRRFLTMRGPARVTISGDEITVEPAKAVVASEDACGVVQVSKFQGGLLSRGPIARR